MEKAQWFIPKNAQKAVDAIRMILVLMLVCFLGGTQLNTVSSAFNRISKAGTTTAFTFASMGDAQSQVTNFLSTTTQISGLNPDLVLFNGDLENAGVTTGYMDPMIGVLKNTNLYNRTFLVRGNHDDQVLESAEIWESYFESPSNSRTLPAGVTEYTAINSSSNYLTYSFIYGNAVFIGLDIPGDSDYIWFTAEMANWLDARLTYAKNLGLTHGFIFFHGPVYCTTDLHCDCPTRADASCTPSSLVTVINKHPIVSAFFHGHEHIMGWTHLDNTRLSGLTSSFEQFITSPAGGWTYNDYLYPDRLDYYYPNIGSSQGFATISVNGGAFTVSMYKVGVTAPVWTKTFTKEVETTPMVSTGAVSNITMTSATVNGYIDALGGSTPTEHGVAWGTSANPTLADNHTALGPLSATGAFSSEVTGLTAGITYYARAYATNASGTAYGQDVTFTAYQLPAVLTRPITGITTTTAIGNGTVTALGVPNPTQYGMAWSTSPDPTIESFKTTEGAASQTGDFASTMKDLIPETLYYARAYITNAAGTVYGDEISFTTPQIQIPVITTEAAINITTTSATLTGAVVTIGFPVPTAYGFAWGSMSNPTITRDNVTTASTASGTFYSHISGLTPGSTYHVRAYATHSNGTVYGPDITFTVYQIPGIITNAVTHLTSNGVTLRGSLVSEYVSNQTIYGFTWGETANPDILTGNVTVADLSSGVFYIELTGLTPGVTYHVRAYATGDSGTVYGGDVSFTIPLAPVVTTQPVTNLTSTSATITGYITVLGVPAPTDYGLVWGMASNPSITVHGGKASLGACCAGGPFSHDITNLDPGTTYHVRAYVTNANGTVYGADVTFITHLPPTVLTRAASNVSITTATLNGNVLVLGNSAVTEHGFAWGTSTNPTIMGSHVNLGPTRVAGAYTYLLTRLTPGTTYHVRAYATNSDGTVYGDDFTIATNFAIFLPTAMQN